MSDKLTLKDCSFAEAGRIIREGYLQVFLVEKLEAYVEQQRGDAYDSATREGQSVVEMLNKDHQRELSTLRAEFAQKRGEDMKKYVARVTEVLRRYHLDVPMLDQRGLSLSQFIDLELTALSGELIAHTESAPPPDPAAIKEANYIVELKRDQHIRKVVKDELSNTVDSTRVIVREEMKRIINVALANCIVDKRCAPEETKDPMWSLENIAKALGL